MAWFPLADGSSPSHGADHNGPTAILLSNHNTKNYGMRARAARLINVKFTPKCVEGDAGTEKLVQFIRTWCDLKLWHIQFNVINADTLKKAQKDNQEFIQLNELDCPVTRERGALQEEHRRRLQESSGLETVIQRCQEKIQARREELNLQERSSRVTRGSITRWLSGRRRPMRGFWRMTKRARAGCWRRRLEAVSAEVLSSTRAI